MKLRKFLLATLVALTAPIALFADVEVNLEDQPAALEKAQSLHNVGELRQQKNGHVYLKVSDKFITEVAPLIECEGHIIAPRHFSKQKGCSRNVGAHFTVIPQPEIVQNELWEINEIHSPYAFEVQEIKSVKLSCKSCAGKYWVLTVSCQPLTDLRVSYALPEKYKGRDFYIVLGRQIPRLPQAFSEKDDEGTPIDINDLDERFCKEDEDGCEEALSFEACFDSEPEEEPVLDEEACEQCPEEEDE